MFYRAYEETRRGVKFLRWYEGDAHVIVPSLYPRRPRRLVSTEGEGETIERLDMDGGMADEPELMATIETNEVAANV